MNFQDLVNFKKKINSTLNIFDWIDGLNTVQETKNSSMLFILRVGIFFYFVLLIFLFHFLYRLVKKQILRKKYFNMLKKYVKENGHNINYWRNKVIKTIDEQEKDFFEKNKLEQQLIDQENF